MSPEPILVPPAAWDAVEKALREHHRWHLDRTDPEPCGDIMLVPAESYADSALYDKTKRALSLLAAARDDELQEYRGTKRPECPGASNQTERTSRGEKPGTTAPPPEAPAAGPVQEAYSKNERAERVMGPRVPKGEEPGIPIDQPVELGYWCPVCRVQPDDGAGNLDERLQWSEYAGFLWCSVCNYDYPSALCVRIVDGPIIPQYRDGEMNHPSHQWGGRDYAVKVFLDSVERAPGPREDAERMRKALEHVSECIEPTLAALRGEDMADAETYLAEALGVARAALRGEAATQGMEEQR